MIRVFLGRAGHPMSVERAHRLWKQNRLQVPKKSRKRRKAEARPRPERSRFPTGVWACDFVFDACANGQKLKCFTVIDECTRESLAIEVAGSLRARHVISVLAHLVVERGPPAVLRSDKGTEFITRTLLEWTLELGIHLGHIDQYDAEGISLTLRTDPQPDRRGPFLNLGLVQKSQAVTRGS